MKEVNLRNSLKPKKSTNILKINMLTTVEGVIISMMMVIRKEEITHMRVMIGGDRDQGLILEKK